MTRNDLIELLRMELYMVLVADGIPTTLAYDWVYSPTSTCQRWGVEIGKPRKV